MLFKGKLWLSKEIREKSETHNENILNFQRDLMTLSSLLSSTRDAMPTYLVRLSWIGVFFVLFVFFVFLCFLLVPSLSYL